MEEARDNIKVLEEQLENEKKCDLLDKYTSLEKDFAASKLITLESWKNRSTLQRFLEWWSSYIVRTISIVPLCLIGISSIKRMPILILLSLTNGA